MADTAGISGCFLEGVFLKKALEAHGDSRVEKSVSDPKKG